MSSTDLQVHPLVRDLFPPMDDTEFEALVADIAAHGQREPIVLYEDMILDGHHRYRACQRLGIEPNFIAYMDDDPVAFAVSLNLRRRHLDESQRAMVAAKLAKLAHGQRQSGQLAAVPTQAEAATMLSVGERSLRRAREVLDHGTPELAQAVERGDVSVSAAAEVASLPEPEQREVLAGGGKAVAAKAKALREEVGAAVAERKWEEAKSKAAAFDEEEPEEAEPEEEPEDDIEETAAAKEEAADDEEDSLTDDEIDAINDAKPPNWKHWSRHLGADRAKRIRGTCLDKEGEVRALFALDWDTEEKLIAAAERGETVSAVAVRDKLEDEAKQLAAKFFDRDPEEARRLHAIIRSHLTCDAFMEALVIKIEWSNGNIYDPDTGCVRPKESEAAA